jgi:hypothetical protein
MLLAYDAYDVQDYASAPHCLRKQLYGQAYLNQGCHLSGVLPWQWCMPQVHTACCNAAHRWSWCTGFSRPPLPGAGASCIGCSSSGEC